MTKLFINDQAVATVQARHPWIMAKDVVRTQGRAPMGTTVDVCTPSGESLAKASISPTSKIRARIWHWQADRPLDHAWFKQAIAQAYDRRIALGYGQDLDHGAFRVVAAEGDGLPGVVIDKYGSVLVVQLTSAGAEKWREAIVDAAASATGARAVFERSDASVRLLEGLERHSATIIGDPDLGSRQQPLRIIEGPASFLVDIQTGHKTGFYLDQAENRALVAGLAKGKRVLNCFSYTGGFGLAAAAAGARDVVNIDSSAPALELGQLAAKGQSYAPQLSWIRADIKKALSGFATDDPSFDVVVLDPPKLAPSKLHVRKALGIYGELNRRALHLLPIGGLLATFSCSGAMSVETFSAMVARAASDVEVQIAVLKRLTAGADHPFNPALAEAGYLKGLLVQRIA